MSTFRSRKATRMAAALVVMIRAGEPWLGAEDRPKETLVAALRHTVSQLDPALPLSEVTSIRQFLEAQAYSKPAFRAALLAVFAALALLMAAIGLYGVLSQQVTERRREVGVRMALGAAPGDVVGMIVRRSLLLTAAGIAVGSLTLIAGMRLLRSFLLTGPGRPLVFVGVAALMLAIALAARVMPGLASGAYRSGRSIAGRVSARPPWGRRSFCVVCLLPVAVGQTWADHRFVSSAFCPWPWGRRSFCVVCLLPVAVGQTIVLCRLPSARGRGADDRFVSPAFCPWPWGRRSFCVVCLLPVAVGRQRHLARGFLVSFASIAVSRSTAAAARNRTGSLSSFNIGSRFFFSAGSLRNANECTAAAPPANPGRAAHPSTQRVSPATCPCRAIARRWRGRRHPDR